MPGNKYYYIRLKENFFDSPELKTIERMRGGYKYSNILLKLYLLSLRDNGRLTLKKNIPYDVETLSKLTGFSKIEVENALKIFRKFELIDILDSGVIYMLDIQDLIGKSSTEADRKREYRNKIKEEKEGHLSRHLTDIYSTEIEKETEKETEKEIELAPNSNPTNSSSSFLSPLEPTPSGRVPRFNGRNLVEVFNGICKAYAPITTDKPFRQALTDRSLEGYTLHDVERVLHNAESSPFLRGEVNEGFKATLGWMLKKDNFEAILHGKYDKYVQDRRQKPKAEYGGGSSHSYQQFFNQLKEKGEEDLVGDDW